jgi:hypothetical protein
MARKNQYEIGVGLDTGSFEKGISNGLVDPLEEAADAFDDLEKAANSADLDKELTKAQKATDKLDDELDDTRDALKKLGHAARDAGDDTKRSMKGAEDGVKEVGEEAGSTAKEAAASFDGSAESILGAFQEVAANAFAGFGPAGAVAGLAIAAGIGIATQEFEKAQEAAEELRMKAVEIAEASSDAGVSTEEWVRGTERVIDRIRELEELKSTDWRWFWEDDPTQLQKWGDALRRLGRSTTEIDDVLTSSTDTVEEYRDGIQEAQNAILKEIDALSAKGFAVTDADRARATALENELAGTQEVLESVNNELSIRQQAEDAKKRMSDAGVENALAQAAAEEEKASRIAAAEQSVQDSVTSAYDSMRSAATDFATTEDGALDINRWLTYTQEHAGAVATYQANLASMKLTPEQWSNLMEMPEQTRTQWVSQFVALPEDARAPYSAALNDLGSDGGNQAAVGFEDSFNPSADVEIEVDDRAALSDIRAVTKPRTVDVKVKTTGKADARDDIDKVAKDRTATIRLNVDTSAAQRAIDSFIWANQNRTITIYGRYIAPRIGKGYM